MGHVSLVDRVPPYVFLINPSAQRLTLVSSDFGWRWADTLPGCGVVSLRALNGATNLTEKTPSISGSFNFCL